MSNLCNNVLYDKNISLKAKGLYVYIQSRGEYFNFSAERIAQDNKDGIDAIRKALIELEKFGYLQRIRRKDSRGFFVIDYILNPNV